MAAQEELRLTVPADEARRLIGTALTEQGFTVQVTPTGSLDVSRGSLGTTLVAGALAGQDMHVRFDIDIAPSENGSVARIRGSGVGGFLKGGAIGASKANDVVRDAAHRLGVRLAEQGVLQDAALVGSGVGTPLPAPYYSPAAGYGGGIPAPTDHENRTNVVAIVALILGFVVPIGGIIAGTVALAQIKRTGEKGRGLAIAGISVGSALIVLLIIGVVLLVTVGLATAQNADSQPDVPGGTSSTPSGPSEPSASPTEEPESVNVFTLAVGDCLDNFSADEVTEVGVRDCAEPHDLEVYSEFELEGDAFPGQDAVETSASDGCYQAFAGFVGLSYEESVLDYTYFLPTQESWETADDRVVSCLIGEPDVQTTGTLANAGH